MSNNNPRLSIKIITQLISTAQLMLIMTVLGAPLTALAVPVFINELHYDNAGTDQDEGIEIAGPSGTDLNGWSVALYNGGAGNVYDTINLTGIIPNQQNNFGTLFFSQAGIQNGPDGFALVDSGTVLQFWSYEDSFVATDGPALGLNSVDMGVAEATATEIGFSLQLAGLGNDSNDFAWAPPSASSYALINPGQTFTPVPLPSSIWLMVTGLLAFLQLKRNK